MATKKRKPKLVKLELVPNVGDLWKALSMWVYAAIAVVGALTVFVDGMQEFLDPVTYGKVSIALAALGAALRAIKQPVISERK